MKYSTGVVAVAALLAIPSTASAQRPVTAVLLLDSPSDQKLAEAVSQQIASLAADEPGFKLKVDRARSNTADGSPQSVGAALNRMLSAKGIDIIIATGPLGGHAALQRTSLPKPVVVLRVLDAQAQGLATKGGSRKKNLNYVVDGGATDRDLSALKSLMDGTRLAIVVDQRMTRAIPKLGASLSAKARALGLSPTVVSIDPERPAAGAQSISANGVLLFGLEALGGANRTALLSALHARRLRTFSSHGRDDVEAGALGGLRSATDQAQLSRRAAINTVRIASREAAKDIEVAIQRADALAINVGTADALGFEPSFDLLSAAKQVGTRAASKNARAINLRTVVDEVLKSNLDLAAHLHQINAAAEDVDRALSTMLPKFNVSLDARIIDPRRAEASFGIEPQRQGRVVLDTQGIIFSDKLFANYSIQKSLQGAREEERKAIELDAVLGASKAYLGVLQAGVLERIQLENTRRTRANLEQARLRSQVGSAGPTEILRWESQLAMDQRQALEASSLRKLASMQLNRLLHRRQEEQFHIENQAEDERMIGIAPSALDPHLKSEQQFGRLREVLVRHGVESAPELRAFHEAVQAAERVSSAAFRTAFVPTLGFGGQVAYFLFRDGLGSAPPALPDGLTPEQAFLFNQILPPPIKNVTYQFGAFLTLPLPIDLEVFADIRKAEAELARRRTELESAEEKVEQRIRSAAFAVGASYPGVALAQASATAARKNFKIAQAAYGTGAVGVLDLLDAQNLALVADQLAASAEYKFMADQLDLERAVGSFLFMMPKEQQSEWLQKIQSELAQR